MSPARPGGLAGADPPRRILIIGSGGAGKSTLARSLAERLGLPLVHLDRHYWRPGWTPTPDPEWREEVERLIAADAWVMDGNYGGTMARRLERAQMVVWLDLPRRVCLWRVLRRRLRHAGRVRPELPPGCPERLTLDFVGWIWTYPARRRPGVQQRLAALPPAVRVVTLRSSREVKMFLTAHQPPTSNLQLLDRHHHAR